MQTRTMTLNEIQQTGLAILSRELGPVGMVRFLQMFETGEGNYTVEREQWLQNQSVDEIARRIQAKHTDTPQNE